MPKTFEYKEAKEQIKYYKKLLNELKKGTNFSSICQDELKQQIQILHSKKFFSYLVERGIKGFPIDFSDNNLNIFLTYIYYFKEGCNFADICTSLYSNYGFEIDKLLNKLSSGSNIVFWFFSSKNKKISVEEAYNKLVQMRESSFVSSTIEVINKINSLKNTSFEFIEADYQNNVNEYKETVRNVNPTVFNENGNAQIFNVYENYYSKTIAKFEEVKNSIQDCIQDVKNSIDKLLAENLVDSLRGISVDELARDKSGIKTKYLKDAGYQNLADVFAASVMQISSVYGISQDKAYTIKRKCDSFAKNFYKELKIKLSTDNKTKAASDVVKSISIYLKRIELVEKIEDLNAQYGDNLKKAFSVFNKVGNGVIWPFLTELEINNTKEMYNYVKLTLSSKYKPIVNNILKEFRMNKIDYNYSWNEFAANSIKFYNIIEKLYPGVLGTDDAIYGLPAELARQIQDECFFPDGLLCTLRKYQEWGVKYILHQEKVLLGDEMGLGKTIQAIATMVSLKNTGATHFLVVCPASVVTNWCREIMKHSRLRVTKIHGNNKILAFNSWLKTGGVAVVNFESTSYIKLDDNYKFSLLVVDEAHYIKNEFAIRSINTRLIAQHADRLLFMTGTALENNVDEMISLVDALRPSIANNIKDLAFMSTAPQFRERIAPVYYRRKREDVLTELPDKIESKEWCVLNAEEESIYEEAILDKRYQDARRVSWNIDDLNKSCKAKRLKEIVEEAESEGRKILVFSFFLDTIAKIHEFLKGRCLNPINGSINVNRRQEIIDEFDSAPPGTVLLAQINTGGTGVNIQSASVVVICEPQFKPSIENQAISRAYRMGQSRNVLVYRLLCLDTVDEKLSEVLEEKQKIFDTFADKSVAAQQNYEIDDKTFGNIIKEEIERINQKRGISSETIQDIKAPIEKQKSIQLKDYLYNPIVISKVGKEYYDMIMKMSYDELVQFLINKYGPAKHDYFVNQNCRTKNKKVLRIDEGLFCHHIDENKAIMLSNDKYAIQNSFDYQKASRLVYCNFLEHFMLHILIVEEPKDKDANMNEIQGIGGAVNFMCKQLNDFYCGYKFKREWLIKTTSIVENDYDSYILMLKRLWNDIKNNELLSLMISKKDLAVGWDGIVYSKILKEL